MTNRGDVSLVNSATIRYGSSLRAVPIETTLERAARFAGRLGITRVTDITRLDRVGVPVFASIRPGAMRGSLCVNAGKGMTADEARAGAVMEGIEFALAEPGVSRVEWRQATARDVLDGRDRCDAVLDFCPAMGSRIPLDEPMVCVGAEELRSGDRCLVPAELVFLPRVPGAVGRAWFGTNSNGLASGNTLLEATVHALVEVIERDVCSFHMIRDSSWVVESGTLPPAIRALLNAIDRAGLRLIVRCQPNEFDIPWFKATLADPDSRSPLYVNGGYGCHPHREIALVRAITEALQSRLTFIHGGRDDLVDQVNKHRRRSDDERAAYARAVVEAHKVGPTAGYENAPDASAVTGDLESAFAWLMDRLDERGFLMVCRVAYTSDRDELQVVRVLVPGLEFVTEANRRVGRRIRDCARDN